MVEIKGIIGLFLETISVFAWGHTDDFEKIPIKTGNGGKTRIKANKRDGVLRRSKQTLGVIHAQRGYVVVEGNPHFLVEKLGKVRGVIACVFGYVL